MTFGYAQPFTFKLHGKPACSNPGTAAKFSAVRHGVTEVVLSDGRRVRASLQIQGVNPSPQKPGSLDISYRVVTEIVERPEAPVHAVHETLQ